MKTLNRLCSLTALIILISGAGGCSLIKETRNDAQSAAGDTVGQITRSQAMSDLTQTTAALQQYYVQENKYPETLSDLKLELYHPKDLDYDAKTGKLRSKTFPDL
jgi:hypothetical protein